MKKAVRISVWFFLVIFILVMNACSFQIELPVGTWVSEDGSIVIHFSEDPFGDNAGTIEMDEEIYPVYWGYNFRSGLTFFDASDGSLDTSRTFFSVHCKWKGDSRFEMTVQNSNVDEYPEDTKIILTKMEQEQTESG